MKHKGTESLETNRLLLRKFQLEDANQMYTNWANDEKVSKYVTWSAHTSVNVTLESLKLRVANYVDKSFYSWGIELKETGVLIGDISVVSISEVNSTVEIGYVIGQQWWNRGYTTEAFRSVIDFLFQQVGANRIEARFDICNPASGKVMEKCGLQYEGTHRQSRFVKERYVTQSVYALLLEDYAKLSTQ